jgi:hypothetical protein
MGDRGGEVTAMKKCTVIVLTLLVAMVLLDSMLLPAHAAYVNKIDGLYVDTSGTNYIGRLYGFPWIWGTRTWQIPSQQGETTVPYVSSATIGSNGTTVTIVFSETVVTTNYANGDFNLDCGTAGSNIALNSISGLGTTRTFTTSATVNAGDTCNCDYVGAANHIEDASGIDLSRALTDIAVTNNSTQGATCTDANPLGSGGCVGYLACQNFEGTGLDNNETYGPLSQGGSIDWVVDSNSPGCSGCVQNPNYTVNPGRGLQSLRLVNGTQGSYYLSDVGSGTGGVASFYIFFRLKIVSSPSMDYADLLSAWDRGVVGPNPDRAGNMTILQTSGGELYLGSNVGAESSTYTPALKRGQWYYVWGYFNRATNGNNGQAWLRISTTRTMPTTNTIEKHDFNMGNNFIAVGFTTSNTSKTTAYEYHIDQVLIKTTPIGTVCE